MPLTPASPTAESDAPSEQDISNKRRVESLGLLAGGVAHDFNNILTSILGNASMAKELAGPGSPVQEFIDEVELAAMRAADLCNQLLAYAGRGDCALRETDLNMLVEQSAAMLSASVAGKGLLRFHLAPDLPPMMGSADSLRQVLVNLVANASESFGDRLGTITVSTGKVEGDVAEFGALKPESLAQRYVFLQVADEGLGMDEETLLRLFDPFFSRKGSSRGLGMAGVFGVVRSHNGGLSVASRAGEGTTVRVLFPAADGGETAIEEPEEHGPSDWRGEGLVLVADDEKAVRGVAGRMLEGLGFDVLYAEDGQAALETVARRGDGLQFVLLDLSMPKLNGEETFRQIRLVQPGLPVLLMSGFSGKEASEAVPSEGFIQKPFTARVLREKVRAIVG